MTKRIPLDRLREISKQRSIRGTHLPQDRGERPEAPMDQEPHPVEWPIRASMWL